MNYQFQAIGIIHSCFKEKFGIPRQPGLVTEARAVLELHPPFDCPEALAELKGFSHVWVVFVFHQAMREKWRPTVRPPRLGGNQRIGVFASRSPFRPNPIGLSVVALESIDCQAGHCQLHLRGADLLDGTPVLDIKPYLPYADAVSEANGGFADKAPATDLRVQFSELAEAQCEALEQTTYPGLHLLIEQILQADPRPAYYPGRGERQNFGMRLYDFDLQWQVIESEITVIALRPMDALSAPD